MDDTRQKQDKSGQRPQEDLTNVVSALQQAVVAVNLLTKNISAIFPSTS